MHRLERAGVQLGQAPEEVRAVGSRLMMAVNEKVSPVVEIRVTALQGSTSVSSETPEETDGHNETSLFVLTAKPAVHPSLEASDSSRRPRLARGLNETIRI